MKKGIFSSIKNILKRDGITKRIDFYILITYIFVASSAIILFNLNYFFSTLLYLLVPSIYLTLANPRSFRKTIYYSILFGIPFSIIFDYIAIVSDSWHETTMFNFKFLGVVPVENTLWAILMIYVTIIVYEYVFDQGGDRIHFPKRIKYLVYVFLILGTTFALIYSLNRELLVIKYFYIIFTLFVFIIPIFLITKAFPNLIPKLLLQGFAFSFAGFIYEVVSGYNGHWKFSGNEYIGMIRILQVTFPIEELLWILLSVPAFICIYEFFADDRK